MRPVHLRAAMALFAFSCRLGCGGDKAPEPVDVRGKVVGPDGKAPPRIVLTFQPVDDAIKHIKVPAVVSEPDGRFQVSCPPGRYRVTPAAVPGQHGGPPSAGPIGTPGAPPDAVPVGG